LHGFDAGEHLVDVHGVKQRLVVAGLEFFRTYEEAMRVFLNPVSNIVAGKSIQLRFADFLAFEFGFTGKRDDGFVWALDLRQVIAEREEILNRR
jgi:hypothetical protein